MYSVIDEPATRWAFLRSNGAPPGMSLRVLGIPGLILASLLALQQVATAPTLADARETETWIGEPLLPSAGEPPLPSAGE